jgi:hypothetical protein
MESWTFRKSLPLLQTYFALVGFERLEQGRSTTRPATSDYEMERGNERSDVLFRLLLGLTGLASSQNSILYRRIGCRVTSLLAWCNECGCVFNFTDNFKNERRLVEALEESPRSITHVFAYTALQGLTVTLDRL